jgi:hypothetical protein
MLVGTGWATDFAKVKFYVELNEEDLGSLLAAEGLTEAPLTVRERFRLLKSEAEVLSAAAAHGHFPDAAKKFQAASAARDKIIADIRACLHGDSEAV